MSIYQSVPVICFGLLSILISQHASFSSELSRDDFSPKFFLWDSDAIIEATYVGDSDIYFKNCGSYTKINKFLALNSISGDINPGDYFYSLSILENPIINNNYILVLVKNNNDFLGIECNKNFSNKDIYVEFSGMFNSTYPVVVDLDGRNKRIVIDNYESSIFKELSISGCGNGICEVMYFDVISYISKTMKDNPFQE